MVGKYNIIIEDARVKYELTVKRHYTIITGDSATGKTTLINMLQSPYVKRVCDVKLIAPNATDWLEVVNNTSNSIVFLDEDIVGGFSDYVVKILNNSNNYFVLITRDLIKNISYSVKEIYTIKSEKRYNSLGKLYTFNTLEQIKYTVSKLSTNYMIITEDSNFGNSYFSDIIGVICEKGDGKNQLLSKLNKQFKDVDKVLAIVDGAAYGACIDDMLTFMETYPHKSIIVLMPESLEYLLLKVHLSKGELKQVDEAYNYCHLASWETYFTMLLEVKTLGTVFEYHKNGYNKRFTTYGFDVIKLLEKSDAIVSGNTVNIFGLTNNFS